MKIEAITLREIQMPLVHFFETSFGRTYSRRILLVTVHCEGIDGWGESVAGEDPYYSSEWIESAWPTMTKYLIPALLGQRIESARECPALFGKVRAHRMSKAALENALWDVETVQKRQPLWKLLGGTRREIPCGVSIGIQDSVEQLLEKVQIELAAGYRRIKIKVKPGWDLNVLERIRSRWSDITLSCDANSAYTLDQIEHLRGFDQFNLLMVEQPLWNDDIYYHARLQKELRTAICLDESIVSARSAAFAAESGACRIINVKVGRIGGFSEAIRVHDVAQFYKIPVWCGGMLETGIGRGHNIALSTLANFSLPGDVSASKRYWKEDIIDPEVEVSPQGMIALGDQPGTGYRVKTDLIEKLTVRKETLRP
jgi:o-succinylbenzoate synthase